MSPCTIRPKALPSQFRPGPTAKAEMVNRTN